MNPSIKFSVLVCTYNRHELLKTVLHSLVEETLEKPDEVVVVNGGDERADEVVKSFMGRGSVEVRLIKTINKNLAASRNIGLAQCRGDIIAMTDDDARVFPDWVMQMKRAHAEHPEAGAVGGLVIGTNTDSIVGKVADAITFPVWDKPQFVRTLPGVNISYKREVVEKIGLQDETLFRGEDVDYNWRIQKASYKTHCSSSRHLEQSERSRHDGNFGISPSFARRNDHQETGATHYKVYFDPAIKVYHHHRPTLKALINQHYMYGRAYYLVRKKWPEMYSVYPHSLKTPKSFLKLANFFISLLYQPFLSAVRVPGFLEKLAAIPILFVMGIAWKLGMWKQFHYESRK